MIRQLYHRLAMTWLRLSAQRRLPRLTWPGGDVLVIAPHPDDEVLGAGGCMLAAKAAGAAVHVLYLTDGEGAGSHADKSQIVAARTQLTHRALEHLPIDPKAVHRLHLPDGAVPHPGASEFDAVSGQIAALIDRLQPAHVLATHALDYWPYDHVACDALARVAVRRARHQSQLWLYWVWAWYNVRPWRMNWSNDIVAVDIQKFKKTKQAMVDIYLDAAAPDGRLWSGDLPPEIRAASQHDFEVFERVAP